ncbi:MAG: hypothetical protein PHT69_07780 [Bacteroidales bacterium]|nr:hypothetical protein [Bacteroidales bacterium]
MNILFESHKEFLRELCKGNVNFILVGGYALIYHGYVRGTGDMDIWLEPDNENKIKVLSILEKLKFSKVSINKLSKLDFKEMVAFHFGDPPEKIDFLTKLSGIQFKEAYKNCNYLDLDNHKIPILRLEDLITNKLMSNRIKDMADVEELKKIYRMKRNEK